MSGLAKKRLRSFPEQIAMLEAVLPISLPAWKRG